MSFYGAYLAPWGMGYAALCALLVGFFTAEIGVSIQHDANHGEEREYCSERLWY